MNSCEDSDESRCNSDEIDSDTEIRLYGAIHHIIDSEEQQLATQVSVSSNNLVDNQSKPNAIEKEDNSHQTKAICSQTMTVSTQPLSNLFRLLDNKLDESDEEFCDDFDFDFDFDFSKNINNNPNKRKFEYIQIDDSSDSDVIIIDDQTNRNQTTNSKPKPPKPVTKIDISLGNVDNLKKSSVEIMNKFYDEDNYDTEEEANAFTRMSGDRNIWEINYNDILLTQNKNKRYYRNKFICNNCNERGHLSRDCPLPKKNPICFLCGFCGHRSDKCRSILCSMCLSSAHKTIHCNVSVNQLVCDECGVRGHQTNQCTYNWRKYHLTTTLALEEPLISYLRQNERKCCYNCGSIGKHFGFECHSKSMDRRMIPVSPLMPNTRKAHCFNGRQRNNTTNECIEEYRRVLCNEFVKNISSNELSHLSASFNKPLDRFDFNDTSASNSASNSVTIASTFNNKNKHIKWVYPETNGTVRTFENSYGSAINDSTSILRNCQKHRDIAERMLCANSTTASYSAHTLTPTQTHQQINNSMQEKSQTQTTPQLNERSKRRKNKRKKRKIIEKESEKRENQSFKQQNGSNFKPYDHLRRIKTNIRRFNRKKKLLL